MQNTILKLLPLFILFLLVVPSTSAHNISVPTNVYFGLPAYGTYINFSTQQTFGDIYRESNYWYYDTTGFQTQDANMTITRLEDQRITFTLEHTGPYISTTKVYVGSRGAPTTVDGANSWSYDTTTYILTISAVHFSEANINIEWPEAYPQTTALYLTYNILYFALPLAAIFILALLAALIIKVATQ